MAREVTSCTAISLSYIDGKKALLFKQAEGHVAFGILPICQLRKRYPKATFGQLLYADFSNSK